MAPELTTTPTRRSALQDISLNAVNKTTAGDACQLGPKASNLEKPSKLVEKSRLIQSVEGAVYGPVCGEARLGGQKRDFGPVESSDRSEAKRFKDKHHIATGGTPGSEVSDMEENTEDLVEPVRHVRPDNPDISSPVYAEDTGSSCLSPASSSTCSQAVLNDSQNTLITEPDDSRAWVIRGEELRQKARELKLRLCLANYKVQTNQIDIPMSQLQIKGTSNSPDLLTLPRAAITPRNRPSSSAGGPANTPNIKLQNPNRETTGSFTSSPPRYVDGASPHRDSAVEPREAVATPLLPRQRHSLLNPPSLGGNVEDRSPARDLTSSVVKGRAANGLLSLMRHQS